MKSSLNNLICSENATLLDALQIINKSGKGFVFVVDANNKLLGVVTDGDARRKLLEGMEMSSSIKNIYNTNFTSAHENSNNEARFALTSDKIKFVPIINDQGQLVDCFEREDFFVPVATPNLRGNEFKYVMDAFLSTWISSSGQYIGQLEKGFAEFCESKHGVAVSNGTVAIHLALLALGVGEGDEVIIPDLTFAATINTVLHARATPVIVDIEKDGWCIDPVEIENAITPKTKAIIPVHLYGQPADMTAIMNIAQKHNLYVIEDCAEAHGATVDGKKVGSIGRIGCFSFFANKIMTTGEGGMCVTDDDEVMEKIRLYKDHGMSKTKKYYHEVVGYNYRMTNLQAAIGVAQLETIDESLNYRKSLEQQYQKELQSVNWIHNQYIYPEHRTKVTWLVSLFLDENINRDGLLAELKKNGYDARPFFVPLSEMDIYKPYANKTYKYSQDIAKRGLNLPTSYDVNEDIVKEIALIIKNFN